MHLTKELSQCSAPESVGNKLSEFRGNVDAVLRAASAMAARRTHAAHCDLRSNPRDVELAKDAYHFQQAFDLIELLRKGLVASKPIPPRLTAHSAFTEVLNAVRTACPEIAASQVLSSSDLARLHEAIETLRSLEQKLAEAGPAVVPTVFTNDSASRANG